MLRLQALSAEANGGDGPSSCVGGRGSTGGLTGSAGRRLTGLYESFRPGGRSSTSGPAGAGGAAVNVAGATGVGGLAGAASAAAAAANLALGETTQGPSSLFIFSEDNFIRRNTKFIIEWPYPFHTHFLGSITHAHESNQIIVALTSLLLHNGVLTLFMSLHLAN